MTIFRMNTGVDKELEALNKARAKREAKQANKKIVIEESEDEGESVPSIFLVIKNLVETRNGSLVDDKMLKGVNRSDVLKYLKSEKISDTLIPAILKKQATSPPPPAPTPPVPQEKPKKVPKAPKAPKEKVPKAPKEKKEKRWVDPATKPETDAQILKMIWSQMGNLRRSEKEDAVTHPDILYQTQQAMNALKLPHVFNRIDPKKVKAFFLKKGVDVPTWMRNYTWVQKPKKPRGRPPKVKPPQPPSENEVRLQNMVENMKSENKFLFQTNEGVRRENQAQHEKLMEAQKYISELENTIREYEAELTRCRAENQELKQRPAPAPEPIPAPSKKATKPKPPLQKFKIINPMTEQQYIDKQIAKNESGMMGAEDINVAKDESKKLFSFFHGLQQKGREYETTGIQYEPSGQMINILTYYLNNKYGLSCRIRGTNNAPITFDLVYTDVNAVVSKQLAEKLRTCISELPPDKNVMFIPINQKVGNTGHHANMMIYRKDTNSIEHFDPNGKTKKFDKFTSILRPIFEKMNINYYPSKINIGFQYIEHTLKKTLGHDIIEREGNEGFCIVWSFLIAEMALSNPTMSTDDILRYLHDKLATPEKNLFLRNVIRGYIHYLYLSLSTFLKDKYNIDLDLTQKVEKSKILQVIKDMDKAFNAQIKERKERKMMGAEDINIKPLPKVIPQKIPEKTPPKKYQDIITEWDTTYLPYILYQQEPKIYDAIEKKVNSLEKKGDGVIIADLLSFIKPFLNELFEYYGSDITALNTIQNGMVYLISYINTDAEPVRDDTSYLGKFFNKRNQLIIYNLLHAK